jgi:hypothetical protein
MTIKLALTYTNCGKTNHLVKTYHDRKRKVPFMPNVIVKSMEPIIRIKTQPVKLEKIRVRYPCMICFKVEHKSRECPRKIEVHNMFRTKPISCNATTSFKLLKIDNVLVNVVNAVTTCN